YGDGRPCRRRRDLLVAAAPRLDIQNVGGKSLVFASCVAALATIVALLGGPHKCTARLAAVFEGVSRRAGRIVMWLVFAMALVQFGIVILRYVFGVNSIFMQESITYMHGAVFLLAAGYALLTDDHVRVDIFYRAASPKRKALVNLVGTYLFLFPVALAALWTGSEYVGHSWAVREGSAEQSGIQGVFLLKSLIPLFALLVAMAGFACAARAGETLRGER
ncbi:MAG: TRAP transporter small permease subunit, partial [Parvularculaceae bacterium]